MQKHISLSVQTHFVVVSSPCFLSRRSGETHARAQTFHVGESGVRVNDSGELPIT